MAEPIKIVLAHEHTLFREGLKRILAQEQDLLVTAEASRPKEVLPAVAAGAGDILLLDLGMPGRGAVQTLLQLKKRDPAVRALILAASEDADGIVDTAKAGACGYLLKDATPETLFRALRTVHLGRLWIDERLPAAADFAAIAAAQAKAEPPRDEADAVESLTRREMEVLKLLAEGLSNDEIAARTFISERTVRGHVTSIFTKLKVNNRVKAALAIIRRGVPSPAPAVSPSPRRPGGPARGR